MKVADAPHQSPVPRYSTVARPLNGLWRDGTKCCGLCLASMRFTQGQHSEASRKAVCGTRDVWDKIQGACLTVGRGIMETADDLLDARFLTNMRRIDGLTGLVYTGSVPSTPTAVENDSR